MKHRLQNQGLASSVARVSLVGFFLAASTAVAAIPSNSDLQAGPAKRVVSRVERAASTNERFAAKDNEMFEVVFSDGGSLALAPGSVAVLERFAFDRATGAGALVIKVEQGAVRMSGGLLNQKTPIEIKVGTTGIVLSNGSAFVNLTGGEVRVSLLVAGTLEVRDGGASQMLSRPGFETVVAAGGVPDAPRRQAPGQAFTDAATINPGLRLGGLARLGNPETAASDVSADRLDDSNLRRRELNYTQAQSGYSVNLPDGTRLALGTAAAGSFQSSGSANLGDASPDVLITQDRQLDPETGDSNSLGAVRQPGLTTNRVLSEGSYDYALTTGQTAPAFSNGPNGVALSSAFGLSYLVSSTLQEGENDIGNGAYLRIPDTDIEKVSLDPTRIVLFPGQVNKELFTETSVSGVFKNASGTETVFTRITVFDDGFYVLGDGFKRDTVFALVTPFVQNSSDNIEGPFAYAIPHAFVFGAPSRLSINRLDGTLSLTSSLSGGGFGAADDGTPFLDPSNFGLSADTLDGYRSLIAADAGRPPIQQSDTAQFNPLDANGKISLGVASLSAGFARSSQWDDVDARDIGVDLGGKIFPRATDNFVAVATTDSYGHTGFFATGDVGSGRTVDGSASIDSFVVSRGLDPADFVGSGSSFGLRGLSDAQLFRSFLPAASGEIASGSTPFQVANPASSANGDLSARTFQADFQLASDGSESSISVTLGKLTYDSNGFGLELSPAPPDPLAVAVTDPRTRVTFAGSTVGSSRTRGAGGALASPTLFTNSLIASAVGGGGTWNSTTERPGYAGFLVLENVSNDAQALAPLSASQISAGRTALDQPVLAALIAEDFAALLYRASSPETSLETYISSVEAMDANEIRIELANLRVGSRTSALQALTKPMFLEVLAALNASPLHGLSAVQIMALKAPSLTGLSAVEIAALAAGGASRPLATSVQNSNFGLLRLAAGVTSKAVASTLDRTVGSPSTGSFDGYVAGLHQVAGGTSDGLYLGNLNLKLDAVSATTHASITYARPVGAQLSGAQPFTGLEPVQQPIELGEAVGGSPAAENGYSAYVKPGEYGASTTTLGGATAALVAGEGVKAGLGTERAGRITPYQHVQWGFFFGDLIPQNNLRTHSALSTWVAGRRADSGERVEGIASYQGHAIGTVVRQGVDAAVYVAVGTFEQSWNLASRTGSMSLDFDGSRYQGDRLGQTNGPGLAYGGVLNRTGGNLQAGIAGELVDVSNLRPHGTIGQFQIRGVTADYQANGTFAGDVRH